MIVGPAGIVKPPSAETLHDRIVVGRLAPAGRQAGEPYPVGGNFTQGIAKGAMINAEAAQRGVLQAIRDLHVDGTFTAVLTDFYASVLPKYLDLNLTSASEQSSNGSYGQHRQDWVRRQYDFVFTLQKWARKFRLTEDLTEAGEPLPWILDFARQFCESRSFDSVIDVGVKEKMPPPASPGWGWVLLDEPDTPTASVWIKRNLPALKEHYRSVRERRRSPRPAHPAKGNLDHYKWFVLHVCGGLKPNQIAERPGMRRDLSVIRKGIAEVQEALGLSAN
jgi:hypothetical protein